MLVTETIGKIMRLHSNKEELYDSLPHCNFPTILPYIGNTYAGEQFCIVYITTRSTTDR